MTCRGRDSEVEVEEEEYAIVQIDGLLLDANLLKEKVGSCKFFKLDDPEPVLQIGNQFFKGPLNYTSGTSICFEETDASKSSQARERHSDSINNKDSSNKKLSYFVKTDKVFNMKRVFLQRKGNENTTAREGSGSSEAATPMDSS